ncbi:MAG: xylulose kinase [Gemmataceae bacterium]|nr:xylulose kinase [Gemmataceae bacterium]
MTTSLKYVPASALITGWDFSTSGVKCLAFDVEGNTVADIRLPTDLWTKGRVAELNLMQLEGQARASVRAIAHALREKGRLHDWLAGGISATHHTAGRIDAQHNQVRRAICWNDPSLAKYHEIGVERLGGEEHVRELLGGPWAIRYSLSHLVKDETTLDDEDWRRTDKILTHGALAAGYLTGNFDVISVSSAASTGIMNFESRVWCEEMLDALEDPDHRKLVLQQLPRIVHQFEPIGPLRSSLVLEARLDPGHVPMVFPTSDDQQAGLIGGGAVDSGQMAIILGTSAVVNSSSMNLPKTDKLDVMRLNWDPYLWMRCYNNGAQFLNEIVGKKPKWSGLDAEGSQAPAGCDGAMVLPFIFAEPSLGIKKPRFRWLPKKPRERGTRYRAALEALAYLIALGVKQHEKGGQAITRITVSGGVARSELMCKILASVLGKPIQLLASDEGPALGAAVTALAAMENHLRQEHGEKPTFTVADAVARMVRFRATVEPDPKWAEVYAKGLKKFEKSAGIMKK